jgi:hypothetical protein
LKVLLPTPPQSYNSVFITQAFDAIKRALSPGVSQDEAAPRILLQSKNGTVYQITVNNDGTLAVASGSTITLVKNAGKTRI